MASARSDERTVSETGLDWQIFHQASSLTGAVFARLALAGVETLHLVIELLLARLFLPDLHIHTKIYAQAPGLTRQSAGSDLAADSMQSTRNLLIKFKMQKME